MATGSCNCGAVTFQLEDDPTDVYVCHCSICRKATGSQGIAVVLVAKDRFHWLSGVEAIRRWRKPDGDWQIGFCSACGSPVPDENDAEKLFVPAGSLTTGAEKLQVAHHVWVDSKAPWDEIGDSGKQHPQGFRG